MKLITPMKIESQNKTQWSHWTAYKKYKDSFFWALRAAMLDAKVRAPHLSPGWRVNVKIVSYRTKLLDYGNLVGGAKPIPDFLVVMKFLKDDNPKWCDIQYDQFIDKENPRTEIEVIE